MLGPSHVIVAIAEIIKEVIIREVRHEIIVLIADRLKVVMGEWRKGFIATVAHRTGMLFYRM
jgi:hypothetical protein